MSRRSRFLRPVSTALATLALLLAGGPVLADTTPTDAGPPPAAPGNVFATPWRESATVTWSPVTGATSYTATASTTGGTCTVSATALRQCTVTGLADGVPVSFIVIASGPGGASASSDPSPAVVPDPDQTAPAIGTVTVAPARLPAGGGTVTVTAHVTDDSSGVAADAPPVVALGDDLQDRIVGGAMTLTSGTAADGVWSGEIQVPADAAPGVWYPRFSPLHDGDGHVGQETVARTAPFGLGTTLAPATVSVEQLPGRVVRVSWTPPTDDGGVPVGRYELVQDVPGTASTTSVEPATARSVVLDEERLSASAWVRFGVRAGNAANRSDPVWSDYLHVPAMAPGPATVLEATPGTETLHVSWYPPTTLHGGTIDGYEVQTQPAGGACYVDVRTSVSWTQHSCDVSGLDDGAPYTVTVTAIGGAGTSTVSGGPFVPNGVIAEPDSVTSAVTGPGRAVVRWAYSHPARPDGFRIVLAPQEANAALPSIATTVGAVRAATVTGLRPGVVYRPAVVALCAAAHQSPAAHGSYVESQVPAAPAPRAAATSRTGVRLAWSPVGGVLPVDRYEVRLTAAAGARDVVVGPGATAPTVWRLQPATTYQAVVRAHDVAGWGAWSAPTTVRTRS